MAVPKSWAGFSQGWDQGQHSDTRFNITAFLQHGMHIEHSPSQHCQLLFSAALQRLSPVVPAGRHAGRYMPPCWNEYFGVQGKQASGAGSRVGIRAVRLSGCLHCHSHFVLLLHSWSRQS